MYVSITTNIVRNTIDPNNFYYIIFLYKKYWLPSNFEALCDSTRCTSSRLPLYLMYV